MVALVRNPSIINEKFSEYFLPTVLISLANNLAVIIDSIMVGNILGSSEMAAIQLFSPINQLYFALTVLFGLGTSTLISLAKGQRDEKKADSILTVAFITITVLVIVLMVIQLLFLNQIVSFLTPLENMKELTTEYYIPFLYGTPFYLFLCSFVYCIRSDGRPKFASNLIILSNVVNLVLDYVLMAIFKMGISGSSLATVIGNVLAFFIMLSQFWYKGNTLHFDFSILGRVKDFFNELGVIITTGLSGAFATLLVTVRVFFLNHLVQQYGDNEGIVAMSVASMGLILISSFVMGACQTMVTLVSTFYAQQDNKGVIFTIRRTVIVLMLITLITVILLELFPSAFAVLFGQKTAAELAETNLALRITALSYPGLGLTFLVLYYLTATQRNTMSLIVSFLNGLLSVPVAFICSYFLGLNGVWVGILIAQYLTLTFAIGMFEYVKRKSHGKYKSILLLEPESENEVVSFTLKTDTSLEELEKALLDKTGLNRMSVSKITEAIENISLNDSTPFYIDVRIFENNPDLELYFRVNKTEIDLGELEKTGQVEIDQLLGMNEIKYTIQN